MKAIMTKAELESSMNTNNGFYPTYLVERVDDRINNEYEINKSEINKIPSSFFVRISKRYSGPAQYSPYIDVQKCINEKELKCIIESGVKEVKREAWGGWSETYWSMIV